MAELQASDLLDSMDLRLTHWRELAALQVDFLQMLGTYKLDTAKAELVSAVASGQWSLARIKAQIAQELSVVLRRMRRSQYRINRRLRQIGRQAKALDRIRSGEDLPLSLATPMWAAYTVFERMAPSEVISTLIQSDIHPQAKHPTSYIDLRDPTRPCKAPPEHVDNVHALIAWIRRHRYMPKRGTHAYRQIIDGISKIADVSDSEIASLKTAIQQMERGTYDTWKPLELAALPDSIDVEKIIKLGSR